MHWLGVARAEQVTLHPCQGYDPKEQILPQKSSASCPRAARRATEHTDMLPLTLRMQEWQALHQWSWTEEWAGVWGFLQAPVAFSMAFLWRKGVDEDWVLPLLNQRGKHGESMGNMEREGGGQERSIFARLQLYCSFRGQEWGSLQSKTTEVWQAGIPLALLSACRQAAQFLWHSIAAMSWWRSFQSLGFPVLSWQQLLSRSCWNPFSHSVNATHRKVGCFHQSPSLSLRFDWLRIGRGAVLLQAWLIFYEHDWSFILQERFEELWIANRVLIAQKTNTLSVINICH